MLTSIGLDHTEWLGETELEIAAEKLAVLRDQTTLVLGRVSPAVAALAERTAAERGARLVRAPEDPGPELRLLAPGGFQRRNFALARAAAEAFLGELRPRAGRRGRGERCRSPAGWSGSPSSRRPTSTPPTTPTAPRALAEALPAVTGGRRVVACLAILADKDAAAMVAGAGAGARAGGLHRAPGARRCRRTGGPAPRSRPAAELVAACAAGRAGGRGRADFEAALRRALRARRRAARGGLLVAGSHYGIAPARAAVAEPLRRGP